MRNSLGRGTGIGDLRAGERLRFGRRRLLALLVGLLLWPILRPRRSSAVPEETQRALLGSRFVYVSPLRGDASESSCHGEVWYGWLDASVVMIASRDSWKARALDRGLTRARIWVGDYGTVSRLLGSNEAFRAGPHFEARAELVRDPALLDRLLASYERKYPGEIGTWRKRMRDGYQDGSRLLIRYTPV